MTNERFKQITNNSQNDLFKLCYEVYLEESRGQKIDRETFDSVFNMYIMMNGGMGTIISNLKKRYENK